MGINNGGQMVSGYKMDCRGNILCCGLTISDINTITNNSVFTLANYELLISPPTATTSSSLQTIQQGVGFNQNLSLQPTGGYNRQFFNDI